jgi:glycosyltransferase involved in cell wall biosynthesis
MKQGYYDNINFDILRYIPLDAKVLLETGCGAGALGRAYKQKNPFAQYIGIEINEQAAALARRNLDVVSTIDVEQVELTTIIGKDTKIDCLVYGDVLEHLRDPWGVMRQHARYLSDNGQVIACIPNIQHWSVLVNLLRGQWQYGESGLLDRTHLRFFTLDSIKQMFEAAGLYIYEIIPRIFGDKQVMSQAQEILRKSAEAFGTNMQHFHLQTSALQYIVRATKKPLSKRWLLQSFLGETKVCSRVRISEPHSFCQTIPGVRALENVSTVDLGAGREEERKVFIWQRISPQSFSQQQQLIQRGYLSIYEIDDDPLRWPEYEKNDFMAFRSCHAVQVSTERLAEFIRQFNPHVAVFSNQIAKLPPQRSYEPKDYVNIFFGALNREEDYKDIIPCLNKLIGEFGGKVKVTVVHDRKFFDSMQTTNKEFVPFCPYTQYQELLYQADIALLPLQYNRFNSMKSDLKFLECAANGVAALASPTIYQDVIQDGQTGFIYRNADEFEAKLRILISDSELRTKAANQAYEWVKENRLLCRHYKKRLAWYEQLFEKYDLLTKEIYRRMDLK